MLKLNIPEATLQIKKDGGKLLVWDFLRQRWVTLTPEEWVRQHFTHWMTEQLGYPAARLGNEISITQNGMQRRCDSIFYDTYGKPSIIIEYKAPYIKLNEKVLDQAIRYNIVLGVPLLLISNGMEHWSVRIEEKGTPHIKRGVPKYSEMQDSK